MKGEKNTSLTKNISPPSAQTGTSTSSPSSAQAGTSTSVSIDNQTQSISANTCTRQSILLTTALIRLKNRNGKLLEVRALPDSGSEASFMTERIAQQLNLARERVHIPVTGLQGSSSGFVTQSQYPNPAP